MHLESSTTSWRSDQDGEPLALAKRRTQTRGPVQRASTRPSVVPRTDPQGVAAEHAEMLHSVSSGLAFYFAIAYPFASLGNRRRTDATRPMRPCGWQVRTQSLAPFLMFGAMSPDVHVLPPCCKTSRPMMRVLIDRFGMVLDVRGRTGRAQASRSNGMWASM
jgi:hypothetical protein